MRAITIRQPHAWAVIHAGKSPENRTRNITGAYRGLVAIHAGLAKYEQDNMASRAHRAAHGTETPTGIVYGAIIGVVDLVDVHRSDVCESQVNVHWSDVREWCSPWAMPDHQHLALANPRPLTTPVPATGRLGLWTVPDDIAAKVTAQVGGVL